MSRAVCIFCGEEVCAGHSQTFRNNVGIRLRPDVAAEAGSTSLVPSSAKRPRQTQRRFSYFSRPPELGPNLANLHDDALRVLFDALPQTLGYGFELPERPRERATGSKHQNALALASTCRRLSRFYRLEYVTVLELIPTAHGWAEFVARALERFPRVNRISIAESGYRKQRLDFRRALTVRGDRPDEPNRASSIRAIDVPPLSHESDVEALYQLCPKLEEISVPYNFVCSPAMVSLLRGLPLTLCSLRLAGLSATNIADDNASRIGSLKCLQDLTFDRCTGLSSQTCSALSQLSELRRLAILRCPNMNGHLSIALNGMPSLEKLHLVRQTLTMRLLQALPPSLLELNLGSSDFVENELNAALFSRLVNLRSLNVGFYLETWGPLRDLSPTLVTLTLPLCSQLTDSFVELALHGLTNLQNLIVVDDMDEGGALVTDKTMTEICKLPSLTSLSIESSRVTDAGVAESLRSRTTHSLVRINLSGCEKIGDEAAAAVADIPRLEHVDMSFTSISLDGVVELAAGSNRTTMRSLDLSNALRIEDRDWCIDIISGAGFSRGDFVFVFDFEDAEDPDADMRGEEEGDDADSDDDSDDDSEMGENADIEFHEVFVPGMEDDDGVVPDS
jgi:hypothetical protein